MTRSRISIETALGILAASLLAAAAFGPLIGIFFDPQDFKSFLAPLSGGMVIAEYMVESWSWFEGAERVGFFRPVTSLAFMLDYPLWRGNPAGYRLDNILIHIVCCVLVMRLSRAIGAGRAGASMAGVLFAVHPGVQNAVTMIVGRHDLLATAFGLLAVTETIRPVTSGTQPSRRALLLPALLTALALGSKELGMACLVAVPMLWLLYPGPMRASGGLWLVPVGTALVGVVYFAARLVVFGGIGGYSSINPPASMPLHLLVILLQASGAAFFESWTVGAVWLAIAAAMAVNRLRSDRAAWAGAAVMGCVAALFGFQTVAGIPCAHYVYAPASVACAMLGRFADDGKGIRRALPSLAFLALTIPVWFVEFREEGIAHSAATLSAEKVFESLEAVSDRFVPGERYEIWSPVEGTAEEQEMKNVPLYMAFLRPGECIRLRVVRDAPPDPDGRGVFWENGGIVIR
ncbi:MAG TPA: hypothetical protein PLB15_00585 [Candidatus Fermentibacter daniensis]|nr:hypothetical protein [Candidatus Fermentibacter daniensis]